MNTQPKPSGEWTARTVMDMIAKDSNAEWNVADAHTAELAAANEDTEKYRSNCLYWKEQLDAEREKVRILEDSVSDFTRSNGALTTEVLQLREQLSAAETSYKSVDQRCDYLCKQLDAEREKMTLATQMVQIESKRANEAEQKVQTVK